MFLYLIILLCREALLIKASLICATRYLGICFNHKNAIFVYGRSFRRKGINLNSCDYVIYSAVD